MQEIDAIWLSERGDLHDASILSAHSSDHFIEIAIDDEWTNERGLSLPDGEKAPGSLIFENASVTQGALDDAIGGWISGVEMRGTIVHFKFCDRDPLTLQAAGAKWRKEEQRIRTPQFAPGDLYEDCNYHPCLCVGVSEEDDSIWGISLIDGSYPRSCSLSHCGVRKLSVEEAWEIKQRYIRHNGADGWWEPPAP